MPRVVVGLALVIALTAAAARAATMRDLAMPIPGGGALLYGLSLPDGYRAGQSRPLILALHPGG